ncbi:carbonic anhydrase [Mycobacteroides immunogenum]|uniref:Carbonic anhydrase n=1 Tax=Mycobacteroides immunogenum TaxID=83262 RepID=A0A179V575_9MYCO|nr:carbonic anhydrase [Mycobacteroides immunogenum]OAT67058.1 carbonic anhydrase [Mycobacteroides immunogenum]
MRRRAMLLGGLAAAMSTAACERDSRASSQMPATFNFDDPLEALIAGNARFASGRMIHPNQTPQRRAELAAGQHPNAIVFSCIDSRVPPEIVFDQGLGDLFVIRTGAQNHDALVRGSVEYGAVMDHTPLIVVLGHQRCGAVTAAVESLERGTPAPGHLSEVVKSLEPAYRKAKQTPWRTADELIDATVHAQIRQTIAALRADPPLATSTRNESLWIVGAYYSLDTGIVDWIED